MNQELLTALENRRSVRDFESKSIPNPILDAIFRVATRAPTGGGLQSYSLIVTQERERLDELFEIHMQQSMLKNAPIAVTICADVGRTSRWCKLSGAEPGFLNFWGFLLAMADAWSVAQNIVTAAEAYGIASCHSGATFLKALNLIDFFDCPEGVIPVATLALGYPASDSSTEPRRGRLPLHAIVHRERYRQDSDHEILSNYKNKETDDIAFYGRRHKTALTNVKSAAQLYTTLKYPKDSMELFALNFLNALRKQGFFPEESNVNKRDRQMKDQAK